MNRSATLFTLGIGLRATLLAGIAFVVIELLATHRLYVTALLTAGIGAILLLELQRYVARGERLLQRFVEALLAGDFERPAPEPNPLQGFRGLRISIQRAAGTLEAIQVERQQQIHYLQTLIDNVAAAVLVLNEDGSVTLANPAARRLVGQPAGRLEELPAVGARAAAMLARLGPGERVVVRLCTGQRVLALSARFSAGGVTRRLLSLQNIEGELDGVELKASQDVLRVLAHEIMNSLTPISSLAESVRPLVTNMRTVEHHAGDIADAIDAIARRSAGLVSFVGRYRRLAELPPPLPRVLRVADVVQRMDQLMSITLSEKGIDYVSRVDPPELTVHADSDLLEQVLVNLLLNAIEACSGIENPQIEVSCQLGDDAVLIRVADNGCGVDLSRMERIFVPLFTTKPGGSGIGLSLARQIAPAHGGKLEAASNPPRGAVFTLRLPRSSPARQACGAD